MDEENKIEISKITLPKNNPQDGENPYSTYYLKDSTARELIEDLKAINASVVHYIGTTTSLIEDGSTLVPIKIREENIYPNNGDIVLISGRGTTPPREFIFKKSNLGDPEDHSGVWNEFGSTGALKALAFKNSVSGTYTPQGSISASFQGNPVTINVTGSVSGSVTQPTFEGNPTTFSVTGSITDATVSIEYQPSVSMNPLSFSGDSAEIIVSERSINNDNGITYTPSGTIDNIVATPQVSFGTVTGIATQGSLPSLSMEVKNQVLNFDFSAGALPVLSEQKTYVSNVSGISFEPLRFHGNGVRLGATYRPQGTISEPLITGNTVTLTGTVTGPTQTYTGAIQPSGKIKNFDFQDGTIQASASFTPSGSITNGIFEGVTASIVLS